MTFVSQSDEKLEWPESWGAFSRYDKMEQYGQLRWHQNASNNIAAEVWHERRRQLNKWGTQTHDHSDNPEGINFWREKANEMRCVNDYLSARGLPCSWEGILAEEFFEAMAESEWPKRRAELIQCAAVIFAEIEDGDNKRIAKANVDDLISQAEKSLGVEPGHVFMDDDFNS